MSLPRSSRFRLDFTAWALTSGHPRGFDIGSKIVGKRGGFTKQDGETSYAFPRPEDLLELGPSGIRELGFSDDKTRAFLELANNIVSGRINFDSLEKMDNEAVVASLLELRGVGRWTAEYVLLRGLKPLNVFPGDDVGCMWKYTTPACWKVFPRPAS